MDTPTRAATPKHGMLPMVLGVGFGNKKQVDRLQVTQTPKPLNPKHQTQNTKPETLTLKTLHPKPETLQRVVFWIWSCFPNPGLGAEIT